jgi:hypothetical protein
VKEEHPWDKQKIVPYSEVSSFQGAICTENGGLRPGEMSLFSQDVLISQGCYSQVSLYYADDQYRPEFHTSCSSVIKEDRLEPGGVNVF